MNGQRFIVAIGRSPALTHESDMKKPEAPLRFQSAEAAASLEFRVRLYSQRFDRDELFWPAVLNVFELVAFPDVRFSSRLRIIGRLGKQRDVVLLDDAEPHAVAVELTLLAYGDPAGSGTSEFIFMASRVWSLTCSEMAAQARLWG